LDSSFRPAIGITPDEIIAKMLRVYQELNNTNKKKHNLISINNFDDS
jgi:hypothetical protein